MAQEEFINELRMADFESKIPQFKNDPINPDIGVMNRVMGGGFVDERPRETREITQEDFLPVNDEQSPVRQKKKASQKKQKKVGKQQKRQGGRVTKKHPPKRRAVYKAAKRCTFHKLANSIL